MTRHGFVAGTIAVAALASAGCGHHPAQRPAAVVPTPEAATPLPEWAPRNPSPELLRAARVLKPLPEESLQGMLGKTAEGEAILQRYRGIIPACYEFFGTLDDRQIERFRTTKEIRIPTKSLTPKQRGSLDHWFQSYRAAMKGMRPELEDYLLLIYKMGGKEDLSNVDVGFTARAAGAGHMVHIWFWVKLRDGQQVNDFGTAFAQI